MKLRRPAIFLFAAPVVLAAACAASENIDISGSSSGGTPGAAGTSVTGSAGGPGTSGSSGGILSTTGAAGTNGSAGAGQSSGTAGSDAGRGGAGGSGRGGATGSAGRGGAAGGAGGRGGSGGTAGRGGAAGAGRGGTSGGGAGGATSVDGGSATFSQVYASVITAYCFGSACHNPSGAGRPDFSSKSSCYTFFKNQGQLYPGMDPQKSYIYFIMHGDPSATPPSPPYMPPDPNPKVSADGLAIVAAWITAGALNN